MARFKLREENGKPVLDSLERVSSTKRPDIREWLLSSPGAEQMAAVASLRSEAGGINVEGLASRASGELVIGFRSPVANDFAIPVLVASLDSATAVLRARMWLELNVQGISRPANRAEDLLEKRRRGIRAIERIPKQGRERYVAILGHRGRRFDSLRVVIWEPFAAEEKDFLVDYGDLKSQFVAEGIAVTSGPSDGKVDVLIVDDKEGRFMSVTLTLY